MLFVIDEEHILVKTPKIWLANVVTVTIALSESNGQVKKVWAAMYLNIALVIAIIVNHL